MNKQQIINYIAVKLEGLVNGTPPPDGPIQIALLASILRDITRDDDYSSPVGISNASYSTTIPTLAYTNAPEASIISSDSEVRSSRR